MREVYEVGVRLEGGEDFASWCVGGLAKGDGAENGLDPSFCHPLKCPKPATIKTSKNKHFLWF